MELRLMSEEESALFGDLVDPDEDEGYEDSGYPIREHKNVTLKEIFAAARQNGLEHIRGQWFSVGDDHSVGGQRFYEIKGGCALAQAGYNLGVNLSVVDGPRFEGVGNPILDVINLNDDAGIDRSINDVITIVEEKYRDYLDTTIEAEVVDYSNGLPEDVYERL